MNNSLEYLEINPDRSPRASIIWLHGLGANGYDFVDIVPQLKLPAEAGIRFVFPHAPSIPVTINNGYVMPAWYDITSLAATPTAEDEAGIRNSAAAISGLITNEQAAGIPSNKIILAGFSQGGAVALHAGLRYKEPLGGILALSSYLPLSGTLASEINHHNKNIPVMMAHGIHDPVIPIAVAKKSMAIMKHHGYEIAWHSYEMEHSVCNPEITDIAKWLIANLA